MARSRRKVARFGAQMARNGAQMAQNGARLARNGAFWRVHGALSGGGCGLIRALAQAAGTACVTNQAGGGAKVVKPRALGPDLGQRPVADVLQKRHLSSDSQVRANTRNCNMISPDSYVKAATHPHPFFVIPDGALRVEIRDPGFLVHFQAL